MALKKYELDDSNVKRTTAAAKSTAVNSNSKKNGFVLDDSNVKKEKPVNIVTTSHERSQAMGNAITDYKKRRDEAQKAYEQAKEKAQEEAQARTDALRLAAGQRILEEVKGGARLPVTFGMNAIDAAKTNAKINTENREYRNQLATMGNDDPEGGIRKLAAEAYDYQQELNKKREQEQAQKSEDPQYGVAQLQYKKWEAVRNAPKANDNLIKLNAESREIGRQLQAQRGLRANAQNKEKIAELEKQQAAVDAEIDKNYQVLRDAGYREANLWDVTGRSALQGYYNSRAGEEDFNKGVMGSGEAYENEWRGALEDDKFKFVPKNNFQEALSGGSALLGQRAYQMTNARAVASGLAMATGALIAGNAGPQVLVPEETITVPMAYMKGAELASTTSNMEIEAGFAYREMRDNGVPHEIASPVSMVVGGVNGLLENAQLDEILSSIKVLDKVPSTQPLAKKLTGMLVENFPGYLNEIAQEDLQELATMFGVNVAGALAGKDDIISIQEMRDRLIENTKSSALSFMASYGATGAINIANDLNYSRALGRRSTYTQDDISAIAGMDVSDEALAKNGSVSPEFRQAAVEAKDMAKTLADKMANNEKVSGVEKGDFELKMDSFVDAAKKAGVVENTTVPDATQPPENASNRIRPADVIEANYKSVRLGNLTKEQHQSAVDMFAKSLGENGEAAFREMAEKTDSSNLYKAFRVFSNFYNSGLDGRAVTDENAEAAAYIFTGDQLRSFRNAGLADAAVDLEKASTIASNIQKITDSYKGDGKIVEGKVTYSGVNMKGLTSDKAAEVQTWNAMLTKKLGINVQWFASTKDESGNYKGANGYYDSSTNTLALDINAGAMKDGDASTFNTVVSHELTHWMEKYSPSMYREVQSVVMASHANINDMIAVEIQNLDKRHPGKAHTRADAISEIVARSCEDMLTNSDTAKKMLEGLHHNTKRSIFEHVKETFKSISEFFDDVLGRTDSNSVEAKWIRKEKESFEKLAEAWDKALSEGAENAKYLSVKDTKTLEEHGLSEIDGVITSKENAELIEKEGIKKPVNENSMFSYRTEPEWERSVIEKFGDTEDTRRYINAVKAFTDSMVANDAVKNYVPVGNYFYNKMGPLRDNVEYVLTFDMDTSCPRTFQFLNYRNKLQRIAKRPLSYNESVNLLELMRAYGMQIPCSYCYVENKRVLLSASYNNYFGFRNAVMSEKDENKAKTLMYGYKDKKGLPKASQAVFDKWRADRSYNPSVEEVWGATNTARNSVLNYLDSIVDAVDIKKQSEIETLVNEHFDITEKGAKAEISGFVSEWIYDIYAGNQHRYDTENFEDVSEVDEKALSLNHEALAYAKSSSSAKTVENFVPYTDQLKNVDDKVKDYIIGMGGIRKHSSNDFRIDYVQDYFMFFADLAMGGWTGHTYTKNADYGKIFGRTGDRINMSIAMYGNKPGEIRMNEAEGANWKDVQELRKHYKNVGAMAMVTSDAQLSFALNSDWIDMAIPFHASSLDKHVWYDLRSWFDYTSRQLERFYNANEMKLALLQKALKDAGVEFSSDGMQKELIEAARQEGAGVGSKTSTKIINKEIRRLKAVAKENGVAFNSRMSSAEVDAAYEKAFNVKKVYDENGNRIKPHFLPGETVVGGNIIPGHNNDIELYKKLCEEYGVHPRFDNVAVQNASGEYINVVDHEGYIKLIKETARTDSEQEKIKFNFDEYDDYLGMTPMEYAMERLDQEAKNGGYANTAEDPFGVVNEFAKEYLGKDRPIGYLTDRAIETRDILNSMQEKENLKGMETLNSSSEETGLQYDDRDGDTKNASDISEADLRYLLESVQNREFKNDTYIPLRGTTPQFLIDVVNEYSNGETHIMNIPMASQVKHLIQNMEEDDGSSYGKERPHGLDIDDVVEISKRMGHPNYIVLQENGRYSEVVSFYSEKRKKQVVVSIDIAVDGKNQKNYKHGQYMNGYNEGFYNIIVTEFEPDDLDAYLKKNTIIYDKKKMNGNYQVGSGRIVAFTHDSPFIDENVPQDTKDVNGKNSFRGPQNEASVEEYLEKYGSSTASNETGSDKAYSKSEARYPKGYKNEWSADRVGEEKEAMNVRDIIGKMQHDFGVNITEGYVRGNKIRGFFDPKNKGVRTKFANDLPVACHELGHALDSRFDIVNSKLTSKEYDDLIKSYRSHFSDNDYAQSLHASEGFAEYLKQYMQNSDKCKAAYPDFTAKFLKSLDPKTLASLNALADQINAYYVESSKTATNAIVNREYSIMDFRTNSEKIADMGRDFNQAWVDSNYRIKEYDRALGGNAYVYATNAAYSDAVAGQIIYNDITDMDGNYVAPGLRSALSDVNTQDKKEYAEFNEYLVCKHGIERLKYEKDVFPNPVQNDPAWMKNRIKELEAKYPKFSSAADKLYKFEQDLVKTWAVDTGIISQETLNIWNKKYQYHVPLYRATEKGGAIGARRGFANQSSPFKAAKGSTRVIVNPVDNIIDDVVRLVNISKRNKVMQEMRETALKCGNTALFMEKVTKMKAQQVNVAGLKSDIENQLSGKVSKNGLKEVKEVLDGIDDIMLQFSKGNASAAKNEVTILVDGEAEIWKINDQKLYQSITNMSKPARNGFLEAYAVTTRFLTSNITGNNVVWSIFSNAPRDLMTFLTYTKDRNVIDIAKSIGSTYANAIKEKRNQDVSPLYSEYMAMGGGNASAYSADRDLAKKARNDFSKTKAQKYIEWVNPIEWVSFISDTIEMGPRFATYKMCREKGMNQQQAFYEAMDVTTNFRKGGVESRSLNKIVPFFNAGVQGTDKLIRFVTADDAVGGNRKQLATVRVGTMLAVSAAIAGLFYGMNNAGGDDDKKKDYQRLSNYTKNTYFLFPKGDGKYFAVPKPRELGTMISLFERTLEKTIGKNDHSFDEFAQYVNDNYLPSIASDIASLPAEIKDNGLATALEDTAATAIGSMGVLGVIASTLMNRDFLGRSIVSSSLEDYVPEEQYTEASSKLAVAIGRIMKLSPQQIDYLGNQTLGYIWKTQKAWFPMSKDKVDPWLGVSNSYNKDSLYSNDIVNWMYGKRDKSGKASAYKTVEQELENKLDTQISGFYSKFYKLSKNEKETEELRTAKSAVLSRIEDYREEWEEGSESLNKLRDIVIATENVDGGGASLAPATMDTKVKDSDKNEYGLSYSQYYEYQMAYNSEYWNAIDNMEDGLTPEDQVAYIEDAKKLAKYVADNKALEAFGTSKSDKKLDALKESGNLNLETYNVVSALSNVSADVDEDGKTISNSKKYNTIEEIMKTDFSNEEKGTLFAATYPSDQLDDWVNSGKSAYDFMIGQQLAKEISDKDIESDKQYSYIIESKATNSQKLAWFLSNSSKTSSKAYTGWKAIGGSDYDYIKHRADLEKFSGDGKQEKVVRYIKNQTDDVDRQKALWNMAGYKESTFSKYF